MQVVENDETSKYMFKQMQNHSLNQEVVEIIKLENVKTRRVKYFFYKCLPISFLYTGFATQQFHTNMFAHN
jgi:hypothetical protein